MSYQIKVVTDVDTEPITLAMQKAWSQIDIDYAADDAQLQVMITSSRELLEKQTNIGFAPRTLELQWNGLPIEMPFSPTGAITSVSDKDGVLDADKYSVTDYQAKSIMINGVGCASGNEWFYEANNAWAELWKLGNVDLPAVYKCVYITGYVTLPTSLKNALMMQCDFMLKQRGNPTNEIYSMEALRLANQYSRNLIL